MTFTKKSLLPSAILISTAILLLDWTHIFGFPEHNKLHYTSGSEVVKAIYLGRALVRGYRGYLDVMQPTHRQYHEAPARINSNVFARYMDRRLCRSTLRIRESMDSSLREK